MLMTAMLLVLVTGLRGQSNIGIQLYTFRSQMEKDIPGTLRKIHEMGVRELEGGGSYGLSVDSFRNLLKRNSLSIVSVGADYAALQNDLPGIIRNARQFGATYVVCYWIPHDGDHFTINEAQKALEVFNHAGKLLKDKGLRLCYHPHGYEFGPYKKETLFDYMATLLNPDWVNFEMDVFWIRQPGQDPVALLKKYPGRFPLMHLKDRRPGTPGSRNGQADPESNVVLGQGDVGIGEIMQVARKYGVRKFFIEDESSRSMEQVPQSLAYLKMLQR